MERNTTDMPLFDTVSLFHTDKYVSLEQHKEPAFSAPLRRVPLRGNANVPLWDPYGGEMYPVVRPGDRCARFSLLARTKTGADRMGPSWVMSPVSGYVEELRTVSHPLLGRVFCAVIRPDSDVAPLSTTPHSLHAMTEEGVLRAIHQAGIIDEFDRAPLAKKIAEAKAKGVREVAAIALDDSPYVSSALKTVSEFGMEVNDGLSAVLKALDGGSAKLAIYDCDEIELNAERFNFGFVEVIEMRGGFPLISKFKREYYPKGDFLPVGVQALRSAAQALSSGEPQTESIVTVSGDCVGQPMNAVVINGTPLEDVLRVAGITRPPRYVILGDTMTGKTTDDLQTPVVTGMRAITLMNRLEKPDKTECTRCGKCVAVCPMELPVYEALRHYERGETELAADFGAEQCSGCGACSAVCPAGWEVAHIMRHLKQDKKKRQQQEP
ncbi:MAG: 4Fe-4S dicluster domain-containing protein [Clostridia bacterium]|nr:4Fe-4S dicluster domain-containing protein [Clostridia bacterium]